MTQQQLADKIGVALESVNRWENGRLGLRRTSVIALETVLGTIGSKSKRSKRNK